jgi:hypothetical protein
MAGVGCSTFAKVSADRVLSILNIDLRCLKFPAITSLAFSGTVN